MLVMFGFMILALAEMAPPGSLATPVLVKPEIAAKRVAACGFKKAQPRFDDLLQEEVIEISGLTAASEKQLECAAKASLHTFYYVVFPEALDETYQSIYSRMSDEQETAAAREWLEKRGLLSRLPTFESGRSDPSAFAHALEQLCGPKAVGTLKPTAGLTTLSEGALSSGRLDNETFQCLLYASKAAGRPLGFIGNEAYQERP